MSGFSNRDRRALAIGIAALGAIAGVRYGALPYLEIERQTRTALRAERASLERDLRVVTAASDLEGRITEVEGDIAFAARSLVAGPAPEASAAIETLIRTAAARAPARLINVETVGEHPYRAGLTRVSVRASGQTDFQGLLSILAELEATPGIRVEQVHAGSEEEPDDEAVEAVVQTLRFQFKVGALFPPSAEDSE